MIKQSNIIILLGALIAVAVLYIARGVMMPFIAALILAYMFAPVADFLEEKLKLNRVAIAGILVVFILLVIAAIAFILVPLIYEQIGSFIALIPKYKEFINSKVVPVINEHIQVLGPTYVEKAHAAVDKFLGVLFQDIIVFFEEIWKSGVVVLSFIWFFLLIPLISFHLIKDWNKFINAAHHLFPIGHQKIVADLIRQINTSIASFVRGQLNVCIILAFYYSIALSSMGLHFGVFIGVTTGMMLFVPLVGFSLGLICALIAAYFEFQSAMVLVHVGVIFALGSMLESTIAPKLIGDKIGLHPIWIIFFVLVGATLFGFFGVLFAIPIGTIMSILVKFFMTHYYKSSFYQNVPRRIKK